MPTPPTTDDSIDEPPTDEKPTVPVFYHIPQAAADRAIERFKHRREYDKAPARTKWLAEYIYDEIEEKHVFWVEDEPLDDYAESRVESTTIEAIGADDE